VAYLPDDLREVMVGGKFHEILRIALDFGRFARRPYLTIAPRKRPTAKNRTCFVSRPQ
jgi:hypothetical protein